MINWELASTPEYRQMLAKFKQIEPFMEPPFVMEVAAKAHARMRRLTERRGTRGPGEGGRRKRRRPRSAGPRSRPKWWKRITPANCSTTSSAEGKKEYSVQRYKGLGEMNSEQLWQTTMDPERRTLLSVKLEDIAACEMIFTTLMGEDVEARRKFIEENALDVKNLDI